MNSVVLVSDIVWASLIGTGGAVAGAIVSGVVALLIRRFDREADKDRFREEHEKLRRERVLGIREPAAQEIRSFVSSLVLSNERLLLDPELVTDSNAKRGMLRAADEFLTAESSTPLGERNEAAIKSRISSLKLLNDFDDLIRNEQAFRNHMQPLLGRFKEIVSDPRIDPTADDNTANDQAAALLSEAFTVLEEVKYLQRELANQVITFNSMLERYASDPAY